MLICDQCSWESQEREIKVSILGILFPFKFLVALDMFVVVFFHSLEKLVRMRLESSITGQY